jgi:hypothetical protein
MNTFSRLFANQAVRVSAAIVLCSFLWIRAVDADAQPSIATPDQSAKNCGCDDRKGIELYMQNVINDAQRRGVTCESSQVYMMACINVYCSICTDSLLREKCIKIASDYYQNSPGFCLQPAARP